MNYNDLPILYLLNPFSILVVVLSNINFALSLFFLYKLISRKGNDKSTFISCGINSILLVCFFIIFFTFITPIYDAFRAYEPLESAGTGDPRVILHGLIEFIVPMILNFASLSFFLIVWFFLRIFYWLKFEKKDFLTNPSHNL